MLIHLIWALELLSTACTDSLNLPLMHLFDVTTDIILLDECRAPVPGAFYFVLCLDGDRQLRSSLIDRIQCATER